MHLEGRGLAAQALGADARAVDELQQLVLEGGIAGIGVAALQVAGRGALGAQGGHFHGAAQAHAHHQGRTGVGPGRQHGVQHHLAHAFDAVGGHQHPDHALVLGTGSLGGQTQGQAVAGHDAGVDDGRGVVAGVPALEQGLGHTGFAQIAVHIAAAHAFVDGGFKIAARDVYLLPHLGKDHGQAGVLADGDVVPRGDVRVLQQLFQDVAPHGRRLFVQPLPERVPDVGRQMTAGLHGQLGHRRANVLNGDFSHNNSPRHGNAMERPRDRKARSAESAAST